MTISLIIATVGGPNEWLRRLQAELDTRRLSYKLVFDDAQVEPQLSVWDNGACIMHYSGEGVFGTLDDTQAYIEEQHEFYRTQLSDRVSLLEKLIAYSEGAELELTDDDCQMLARTPDVFKSEQVRACLAERWRKVFGYNLDDLATFRLSNQWDWPYTYDDTIELLDELIRLAKVAINSAVESTSKTP